MIQTTELSRYFLRRFFVGRFLRFVLAKSRSCFSVIDFTICFEAPLSEDFERSPRFAARAAPAAFCCFFDFAGIPEITTLTVHADATPDHEKCRMLRFQPDGRGSMARSPFPPGQESSSFCPWKRQQPA
jgi:hypothetical protein